MTLKRFLANRRRAQAVLDLRRFRATPIVTELGLAVHRVRRRWPDDDEVLTECGIRIKEAAGLIAAAESLTRTPPCKNCDRAERRRP